MLQVKQSAALPAPLIVALLLCALIIQTEQQQQQQQQPTDNAATAVAAKAQRVHEPCAEATRAVVNNASVEPHSGKFERANTL